MNAILPLKEAWQLMLERDLQTHGPGDTDPTDMIATALQTGELTAFERTGQQIARIDINQGHIDIFRSVVLGKLTAMDYRTDDREIFLDPDKFAEWINRLFSQNSHTAKDWLLNEVANGGLNSYRNVKAVKTKMIELFKISEREFEAFWRAFVPENHPLRKRGRPRKSPN